MDTKTIMMRAARRGILIPAFNIPYLPMMKPVVKALQDSKCFGLIAVARLEWIKYEAESPQAIHDEYEQSKDANHTRLHLDHVPVIDEDGLRTDYEAVIGEALELGFESVMVDGSRLPLPENIDCTRRVVEMAHAKGIPVEAELGAVLGHESGPLPPYEELFNSRQGFTDPAQARTFVRRSGVDWLSVAIGNIHGSISAANRERQKPRARLDIEHLAKIRAMAQVPLVLHGGSGIPSQYIREASAQGITKINVATAIRQPFEQARKTSLEAAREAVYQAICKLISGELGVAGSAQKLFTEGEDAE